MKINYNFKPLMLSLFLFIIGILGFILNRKNIILMIISIEIMLLSLTLLILISSLEFNDITGQTFSIYIIAVAGAEAVIGLSILVAYYRFITSNFLYYNNIIKQSIHISPNVIESSKNDICNFHKFAYLNGDYNNYINSNFYHKNIRSYSTNSNNYFSNLDPWFITGIFDAESSFIVSITRNLNFTLGWRIQPRIQIKMHEKDRTLILNIQKFFGGIGYVSKPNSNLTVEFRITSINDIVNFIIPHFDKFHLITKKQVDYLLFKKIIFKLLNNKNNKEKLNSFDLQDIINIRAAINWGLNDNLKLSFPNTVPLIRPDYPPLIDGLGSIFRYNIENYWLSGFSTGESNFFIVTQKSKTNNITVSLRFSISQHVRDSLLLENFVKIYNCGYIYKYEKRLICEYIVTKIDDIVEKIIPFFDKYPLEGTKYSNYLNFKEAALIIKNKEHLKPEGLEKILLLKNGKI